MEDEYYKQCLIRMVKNDGMIIRFGNTGAALE
jgi:hypothetical protein